MIDGSMFARFPGYLSKFLDIKFSEVPNGLSAFSKAMAFRWCFFWGDQFCLGEKYVPPFFFSDSQFLYKWTGNLKARYVCGLRFRGSPENPLELMKQVRFGKYSNLP